MTTEQLDLFASPGVHEVAPGWYSGLPGREAECSYVHLIRGPQDPERAPRTPGNSLGTDWKGVNDLLPGQWAKRIEAHLSDGVPRTFNRIAVELTGFTADVVFGENPDKGLWCAVEQRRLVWTTEAPVLFSRMTDRFV